MTWFETLTGFPEATPHQVRENLRLDGQQLTSLVNERSFHTGEFTTPTLKTLRQVVQLPTTGTSVQIEELVADVQSLHQAPFNANAVFQVASQFNCLEMAAPHMSLKTGLAFIRMIGLRAPHVAFALAVGRSFGTTWSSTTVKLVRPLTTRLIA